jgi:glycine cleavage system regulatory protein
MAQHYILTITGPDRPGLVERVAGAVAAHGGNWLESRLIHLGGCFAGVVRVEIPDATAAALQSALGTLSGENLSVSAVPVSGAAAAGAVQLAVEVTGLDHPGIVSQISAAVARAGLNVEEFSSEVTSAPMSGEPLFTAKMELSGPAGVDLPALSASLEKLSEELLVEITLLPQG